MFPHVPPDDPDPDRYTADRECRPVKSEDPKD